MNDETHGSFNRAYFSKVRKGDFVFCMEDQVLQLVLKRGRKLAKLENQETKKVTWVTQMRFNLANYYHLVK